MPDDKELKPADTGSGSSGKKKLIIIVLAVLLLGGGAAAFFLGGSGGEEPGGENPGEPAAQVKETIEYVPMPGPVLFTARAKPKGHLVQMKLVLMVKGEKNRDLAVHHLAAIAAAVSQYVLDINYVDIASPPGRERMKNGILKVIQGKMNAIESEPVVDAVLYDSFVIQ